MLLQLRGTKVLSSQYCSTTQLYFVVTNFSRTVVDKPVTYRLVFALIVCTRLTLYCHLVAIQNISNIAQTISEMLHWVLPREYLVLDAAVVSVAQIFQILTVLIISPIYLPCLSSITTTTTTITQDDTTSATHAI
jgi:hypothetical protein